MDRTFINFCNIAVGLTCMKTYGKNSEAVPMHPKMEASAARTEVDRPILKLTKQYCLVNDV